MNISFPRGIEPHIDSSEGVAFQAVVDGDIVWCVISREALEDHFDLTSSSGQSWVSTFKQNRARIEEVATRLLERSSGTERLLSTGEF
ncbi:DUF1488 domain-containing protein [Undibacterium arcticum]|uniref:DUF1488 domain-containing protein n=1 Tax=Undibacterium arcticum TaxID=1762892 RepID=A0ABV7F7L6_9BURK